MEKYSSEGNQERITKVSGGRTADYVESVLLQSQGKKGIQDKSTCETCIGTEAKYSMG